MIQHLRVNATPGDRLALIDKASPHARYDLMLSEVSQREKATPEDVAALTGRIVWCTAASFASFVRDPQVRRTFRLGDGVVHLAMNCDPNTRDRESIQAAKQFHLHLIYWSPAELAGLANASRFSAVTDSCARRQILDPLAFLGAELVRDGLTGLRIGLPGVEWLMPDAGAVITGQRPMGGLLRLPSWSVLDEPAFAALVCEIHRKLTFFAGVLLEAFTGTGIAPPPWHRHPLLKPGHILANLDKLALSPTSRAGLAALAQGLQGLPPRTAERLARTGSSRRQHLMTLNLPSYTLSLQAARPSPGGPLAFRHNVYMAILPKLFSGIGGAGLLSLRGVPCVRVRRGVGAFSVRQWRERARFQGAFAAYNAARLAGQSGVHFDPVRAFSGPADGWIDP